MTNENDGDDSGGLYYPYYAKWIFFSFIRTHQIPCVNCQLKRFAVHGNFFFSPFESFQNDNDICIHSSIYVRPYNYVFSANSVVACSFATRKTNGIYHFWCGICDDELSLQHKLLIPSLAGACIMFLTKSDFNNQLRGDWLYVLNRTQRARHQTCTTHTIIRCSMEMRM